MVTKIGEDCDMFSTGKEILYKIYVILLKL